MIFGTVHLLTPGAAALSKDLFHSSSTDKPWIVAIQFGIFLTKSVAESMEDLVAVYKVH